MLVWAFGYFGRGRLYGQGGSDVGGGNLVHTLLVIAVILLILRLLHVL
ncbi:MAG TPA: hypothetical protein VIN69_03145 [Candidatus Limnocylindria bacterium]